jgi:transcriptional regulator with PAS, ATPase and Fis domain
LAHERDRAGNKRATERARGSEAVPSSGDEGTYFGKLVGASAAMQALYSVLRRASATDSTVLIEGETGTGKEVTAQAIHDASDRRDGPFIVVDCGAIPGQLLESELFGYQRGAFTGAVNSRAGAFEAASGGSIFLDEVGELDLDLQPKLLRVLESRTIKRVGTNHYAPVDVRVLAATNRNLQDEVKARRFRSDLFYRLAVVHVKIPPLRDRVEDIPLLVRSILSQLGVGGSPLEEVVADPELEQFLASCNWPGNVRQLRNYLEQRLALGSSIPPPAIDSQIPPRPSARIPTLAPLQFTLPPATGPTLPPSSVQPPLPSVQPPARVSVQPVTSPSVQPLMAPSVQPLMGPSVQPLMPPSVQPLMPPSPSVQPAAPVGVQPLLPMSVQPLPEIQLDQPLKAAREQWNRVMEIHYLQRLLSLHAGNVTAAARAAGVNRVHLYRLLWKHGLRSPDRE